MQPNFLDMFHGDNNEHMPDWEKIKAAGVFAIAHKCTQGVNFIDSRYADRMKAAKAAGLIWLAYHFGDASPATRQAEYFLHHAMLDADDGAVCDFEDYPKSQMSLMSALGFMQEVDTVRNRACWLYSGNRIREHITGATFAFFGAHPLWLCEYGPVERPPSPWPHATAWQYSETGHSPGVVGKVDLNVYHGTADDLRALLRKPLPSRTSGEAK